MTDWLMSANSKKYDHKRAFDEQGFIYWRQIRNFEIGDLIYIYCTKPIGRIQYVAKVEEINLPMETVVSDKKYYPDASMQREGEYIKLSMLKEYKGNKLDTFDLEKFHFIPPQGPQRINNKELLEYLVNTFEEVGYD